MLDKNQYFLFQTVGNKITPLVVNPGRIVLTNVTLYFQPYNNAEEKPVIKVKLTSIKRIFQRRYLLRPLGKLFINFSEFFRRLEFCFEMEIFFAGLEIEYTNNKEKSDHIYLTFSKPEDRQKLYHRIIIAQQELKQTLSQPQPDNNNLNNQGRI
jgi:hypothetical protein